MSDMKKENQIGCRDDQQSIEHILAYAVLFEGFKDIITAYFFSFLLSQHEKQESKTLKTQLGHTIFSTIFVVSGFILCMDNTRRTSPKSGQSQP